MGITFRDGTYIQFVRCGRRTIKHGEAAAIWNSNGQHQSVVGPKRVFLFNSTIRFLTHFRAKTNQYLQVSYRNGFIDHIPGPVSMYLDPTSHDDICVQDGIELKEKDVIFVSSLLQSSAAPKKKNPDKISNDNNSRAKNVSDRSMMLKTGLSIVDGPTIFIPGADDVVEILEWNVLPEKILKGKEVPKGKLQVLTLNTYMTWKVQIAIGSAPVKAYVTVLVKYKIDDIEKVARHRDPHAVLIAGLLADAQELDETTITEQDIKSTVMATNAAEGVASGTSSSSSSRTKKLNLTLSQKKSYKNLVQSGESCGFHVGGVRLLDIQPGEKILRDLERQRKVQIDHQLKMARKKDNIQYQKLELEEEHVKLRNRIDLARKEAQMNADLAAEHQVLKLQAIDREIELEQKKQDQMLELKMRNDESTLEFLRSLKEIGVDLTTYMSSLGAAGIAYGSSGPSADLGSSFRPLRYEPGSALHGANMDA